MLRRRRNRPGSGRRGCPAAAGRSYATWGGTRRGGHRAGHDPLACRGTGAGNAVPGRNSGYAAGFSLPSASARARYPPPTRCRWSPRGRVSPNRERPLSGHAVGRRGRPRRRRRPRAPAVGRASPSAPQTAAPTGTGRSRSTARGQGPCRFSFGLSDDRSLTWFFATVSHRVVGSFFSSICRIPRED